MGILPTSPISPTPKEQPKRGKIKQAVPFELPKTVAPAHKNKEIYQLALSQVAGIAQKLSLSQYQELGKIGALILKRGVVDPTKNDPEVEEAIRAFADLYVDSLKKEYHNPLEPFEVYAARIRAEIQKNTHHYAERLEQGYRVLIRELSKP
jgi:hypothetical protein